jgi:hypothetical protein
MKRSIRDIILTIAVGVSTPALGQAFDPMVALRVRPPAPFTLPNALPTIAQIESIEAARARAERDRAEAELLRQQTEAMQRQRQSDSGPSNITTTTQSTVPSPIIRKWLIAAQPRMHLYPDFEQVVFADDVPFTEQVIDLMSGSEYAADIAYYLGKNKIEAAAISEMPTLKAAQSIINIEDRLVNKR